MTSFCSEGKTEPVSPFKSPASLVNFTVEALLGANKAVWPVHLTKQCAVCN